MFLQFYIQQQKFPTVAGHICRCVCISTQTVRHGYQMLCCSQHHVFKRVCFVQCAFSQFQQPWHQGSQFPCTSSQLWGSQFPFCIFLRTIKGVKAVSLFEQSGFFLYQACKCLCKALHCCFIPLPGNLGKTW